MRKRADWGQRAFGILQQQPIYCIHSVSDGCEYWHFHPGREILYVRVGGGCFLTNGKLLPYRAPCFICFDGAFPHGVSVTGYYDRWNVALWREGVKSRWDGEEYDLNLLEKVVDPSDSVAIIQIPHRYTGRIDSLFADLHYELESDAPYALDISILRLKELVLLIQRLHDVGTHRLEPATDTPSTLDLPTRSLLSKVVSYIEEHLHLDLTVDDLTETFYCSRSYLYRLLRDGTGHSFARYLKYRRIDRAKRLLELSDLPIKEVAEQVGIPGPPQFTRAFRELVGLSPSQYRVEGHIRSTRRDTLSSENRNTS